MLPHFDGSCSKFKSKQTLVQQNTSLMLKHIRRTLTGCFQRFTSQTLKKMMIFSLLASAASPKHQNLHKHAQARSAIRFSTCIETPYSSSTAKSGAAEPLQHAPQRRRSPRAAETANDRDPQIPNFAENLSKSVHGRLLTSFDEFPLFIKARWL